MPPANRPAADPNHPMARARRRQDYLDRPRTDTHFSDGSNFITPEQRAQDFERRMELGMVAAPIAGVAAGLGGAYAGPLARFAVEGTKNIPMLLAAAGLGAGVEQLEDKPTVASTAANAFKWAAGARLPISEVLGYVGDVDAGLIQRIPGGLMRFMRNNYPEAVTDVRKALGNTVRTGNEWGVVHNPEDTKLWSSKMPQNLNIDPIYQRMLRIPTRSPDDSFLLHTHPGGSVNPSKADVNLAVTPEGRDIIAAPSKGSPYVVIDRKGVPIGKDYDKYNAAVREHFKTPEMEEFLASKGYIDPDYGDADALGNQVGPMTYLRNLALGDKIDLRYNDLEQYGVSPNEPRIPLADILESYWAKIGGADYCNGGPVKMAGGGKVGALGRLAARLGNEAAPSRRGVTDVIKNKGGNWLSGSVEGALSGLKKGPLDPSQAVRALQAARPGLSAEEARAFLGEVPPQPPINTWIDKQLTNYVKNQMATPEDPVRALAERGVLHFEPPMGQIARGQPGNVPFWVVLNRENAGFPGEGLAQTPLARNWEVLGDRAVNNTNTAGGLRDETGWIAESWEKMIAENLWLNKVPAETRVNDALAPVIRNELGFDHLIDELSSAMAAHTELRAWNDLVKSQKKYGFTREGMEAVGRERGQFLGVKFPSNLPLDLHLNPESLTQVSVPDAVERVAQINAWRTEQARLADLEKMKANLLAKPHKQFENGWRWAELPDAATPEGKKLVQDIGCQGGWCTQTEGNALGYGAHDKGNKLYGLIDPEGRPHVQIHTAGERKMRPDEWFQNNLNRPEIRKAFNSPTYALNPHDKGDYLKIKNFVENYPEYQEYLAQPTPIGIKQIKPFSNSWDSEMVRDFTKKNPNYRKEIEPMIQDFVKNGQWSDVGDLGNTGFAHQYSDFAPDTKAAIARAFPGREIPRYLTTAEASELLNGAQSAIETGFAHGGAVNKIQTPEHFQAIISAIMEQGAPCAC